MEVKFHKPLLIFDRMFIEGLGVDKDMIAHDLEVIFVHPWKLKASGKR